MPERKAKRWALPLACYAAALALWLGGRGFLLARAALPGEDGAPVRQELDFYDFDEQYGLLAPEDFQAEGWFVSTDPDPRLILRFPGGRRVAGFSFLGRTVGRGSGEMVLYYTTKPGEAFSEGRKLWARQAADGAWFFDVGGKTLTALRFDPASYAGVYWQVDAMVLNEEIPPWRYFVPDALQAALLLLAPALLWAALREGLAFLQPVFTRRRFAARWQQTGKKAADRPAKKTAGRPAKKTAGRPAKKTAGRHGGPPGEEDGAPKGSPGR